MKQLLISSEQFFYTMLQPALKAKRFRHVKAVYKLVYVGPKLTPEGDEYLLLKSPKMNSRYAFEPFHIRQAMADDPVRMANFLLGIHEGKLHPSIFAYLLSPAHQADVVTGRVKGFKALARPAGENREMQVETPSDKLTKDFNLGVLMDDDVRKVAKKRDFDRVWQEQVLGERPHLLEEK